MTNSRTNKTAIAEEAAINLNFKLNCKIRHKQTKKTPINKIENDKETKINRTETYDDNVIKSYSASDIEDFFDQQQKQSNQIIQQ